MSVRLTHIHKLYICLLSLEMFNGSSIRATENDVFDTIWQYNSETAV
jgi:hypothetical protein